MTVRGVGTLEIGRYLRPLARSRTERRERARRGEDERRQELAPPSCDQLAREPREEAIAAQIERR
jgi:hypothetical protein